MPLRFKQQRMVEILQELPELFYKHWKEASYKPGFIFDPDWQKYLESDIAGGLFILTARAEGKLVGYYFANLFTHIHYKGISCAFVQGYYLLPEYRAAGNGIRLLKTAENILKKRGIRMLYISCGELLDLVGLLERLGFKKAETGLYKVLGDEHG
jgi:GNAT superfamily N-acetyltransferase